MRVGGMFEADVNRNPKQYAGTDDEHDANVISYLIDVLLPQRDAELAFDDPNPGEKALME